MREKEFEAIISGQLTHHKIQRQKMLDGFENIRRITAQIQLGNSKYDLEDIYAECNKNINYLKQFAVSLEGGKNGN